MLIKYLLASLLLSSPVEDDGWVAVEKTVVVPSHEETDPSIWVLFAKSLGTDHFLVRFPKDPSYSYTSQGVLQIASWNDGVQYQLWVKELRGNPFEERLGEVLALPDVILISMDEAEGNLIYRWNGKWIREHIRVFSLAHQFLFQTSSVEKSAENHQFFISSFSVE